MAISNFRAHPEHPLDGSSAASDLVIYVLRHPVGITSDGDAAENRHRNVTDWRRMLPSHERINVFLFAIEKKTNAEVTAAGKVECEGNRNDIYHVIRKG